MSDELDYKPVPPAKTVTMNARFSVRGRGQPKPYPLEEDEKLEEVLLKRDTGEKLTDYEKMVLLFDAGRDSCHHPH